MDSSRVQSGPAGSASLVEPAGPFCDHGIPHPARLAAETALVTAGVFLAARLVCMGPVAGLQWLLIPAILVAAALLPTWTTRREFPRIGLDHVRQTLWTVITVLVCVLPITFAGIWIAVRLRLPIPLRPAIDAQDGWLAWPLYQLLYVAVAEELFFRGYLQANIMRLLAARPWRSRTVPQSIAIVTSAGCFALAHVFVQGDVVALVTFLPGLLFAWLFIRTRSLLGPILLHGLANISYGIMALMLA